MSLSSSALFCTRHYRNHHNSRAFKDYWIKYRILFHPILVQLSPFVSSLAKSNMLSSIFVIFIQFSVTCLQIWKILLNRNKSIWMNKFVKNICAIFLMLLRKKKWTIFCKNTNGRLKFLMWLT
jgi:hypothetical protein